MAEQTHWSVGLQATVRAVGIQSPKSKTCYLLVVGFLFGIFFDADGVGDRFLQNVSSLSTDYIALYPRR
jgi:hypothetical protein